MFWELVAWLERPPDRSVTLRQREALRLWAEQRERERGRKREKLDAYHPIIVSTLNVKLCK